MKCKVQTRVTGWQPEDGIHSLQKCRSQYWVPNRFFVYDSFLVWGIGIRPSLFLGSNVDRYVLISWWKCNTRTKWKYYQESDGRGNFWRKTEPAVSPISMATTKLHQKVCDLKIAVVQMHPFVFKKISDKSSALVPVFKSKLPSSSHLQLVLQTKVTFRKNPIVRIPCQWLWRKRFLKISNFLQLLIAPRKNVTIRSVKDAYNIDLYCEVEIKKSIASLFDEKGVRSNLKITLS